MDICNDPDKDCPHREVVNGTCTLASGSWACMYYAYDPEDEDEGPDIAFPVVRSNGRYDY
jgi:hypothetical protein